MRQHQGPLGAGFVRNCKTAGRYGDGRGGYGLSLLVRFTKTGYLSKTYQQRLYIEGVATMMGLGSTRQLTLTEARRQAKRNHDEVQRGKPAPRKWSYMKPSFSQVAEDYIDLHSPSWKNPERVAQDWRTSLTTYAYPKFGNAPVNRVKPAHVLASVEANWHSKAPTMRKLLQRIKVIFDLAVVKGHVDSNPVDPVSAALPRNGHKVEHQKALSHANVGAALRTIRDGAGHIDAKLCLELVTLTGVRSGEARGATWDEIDLEAKTWTIPASRMKARQEHRVPLSPQALDVLRQARSLHGDDGLIFRAVRGGSMTDKRIGDILRFNNINSTVHGMRGAFRNWCAETNVPREIAEAALAHIVAGVEGAYLTSDMFARRREVMDAWGDYIIEQGQA